MKETRRGRGKTISERSVALGQIVSDFLEFISQAAMSHKEREREIQLRLDVFTLSFYFGYLSFEFGFRLTEGGFQSLDVRITNNGKREVEGEREGEGGGEMMRKILRHDFSLC